MVSAWCAAAIGVFVALLAWLVGRRAAVVTGVLLAVEPYVVGHSSLLHTDALVAPFGMVGVAALGVALWGRRPDPADGTAPGRRRATARWWVLALAGAASGLCLLTKLNGAFVGPAVTLGAAHRRDRPVAPPVGRRRVGSRAPDGGAWVGGGGRHDHDDRGRLAGALGRPQRPARPCDTSEIMRIGDAQFFLGEATRDPDARFYFVTTALASAPGSSSASRSPASSWWSRWSGAGPTGRTPACCSPSSVGRRRTSSPS